MAFKQYKFTSESLSVFEYLLIICFKIVVAFPLNNNTLFNHIKKIVVKQEVDSSTNISAELLIIQLSQPNSGSNLKTKKTKIRIFKYSIN